MKFRISILLAMLFAASGVYAGSIVTDTVHSRVLGESVACNVYLPRGFKENPGRKYPIVYLLHGLSDDYKAWRDKGQMQKVADELIETGEACEMVIVMPNAGGPDTHNTWNGYFNMQGWNYEDFFFQELIPTMEQRYRAIGDKRHRAVMGLSMGGGGSTVYCLRHPEMFASSYAMSAWLDDWGNRDADDNTKKDKLYMVCQSVHQHSALDFLEHADEETRAKLRTVKWFFDCGDDDELLELSTKIHQLMRRAGIKDELRVHNGGHDWEYWHQALRTALPFATNSFRQQ